MARLFRSKYVTCCHWLAVSPPPGAFWSLFLTSSFTPFPIKMSLTLLLLTSLDSPETASGHRAGPWAAVGPEVSPQITFVPSLTSTHEHSQKKLIVDVMVLVFSFNPINYRHHCLILLLLLEGKDALGISHLLLIIPSQRAARPPVTLPGPNLTSKDAGVLSRRCPGW